MNFIIAFALAIFVQDGAPFKPSEEFELSMDYDLRTRPLPENYKIDYEAGRKNLGPLPFLGLTLKVLQIKPGEGRMKIIDNHRDVIASKKIKPGFEFSFELGFTADMKDRVKAHEYTILFQTPDRKENISRIVIHVAEDGTFLVNNEVRGRL